MWVPVTDIRCKTQNSLVPIYISSPTPSGQFPSKLAGVWVIRLDYELDLEFNGIGGGEFQFSGKVGNPHAPVAESGWVGWIPRMSITAGRKSTVAVGERIREGESGHVLCAGSGSSWRGGGMQK